MSLQGPGDQGGWSPVVVNEDNDEESVESVVTQSTVQSSDSEMDELMLQVTRAGIDVSKKYTHRGGRRNNSKDDNKEKPCKKPFVLRKDPWGDPLQLHDSWPTNMDTLRIVGCNVGGVSYHYDIKEWEQVLGHLYDIQADVFCLSEINLNFFHPHVREKLYEYKHKKDKHIKLHFSCSKPVNKNDEFQMGGTITGLSGRWSGRDISLNLEYPVKSHGRWTLSHMQGKQNCIVTIITVYRVCIQSGQGKNTITIQQQRDIQQDTGHLVNARERYTDDIAKLVQFLQQKSHHVILCGDANDDMNDKSHKNKWRKMLQACNMSIVSDLKFPTATLPATYERGRRCLDMVAISQGIPLSSIRAMGYLSYSDPLPSDHRAIYLDLDAESLFGTHLPDLTKSSFRHFNTKNKKQMDRYVKELKNHYETNNMLTKVTNLRQDILSEKMNKQLL